MTTINAQRQAVVSEAMTWLKTPYHHEGRIKGVGTDCGMLLCEVYHAAGLVPRIDPGHYPRDWHLHRGEERYLAWVETYADKVAVPQPGDIALYQFGRCRAHGAIVVNWPTVIHASIDDGMVVLADGRLGQLEGRLSGFWSLKIWQEAS